MNLLHLDPFSGISGDMFLAAMLDLGVEQTALEAELTKLGLSGWHLHAGRGLKGGIAGTWLQVHVEPDQDPDALHDHPGGHHHPHPHDHDLAPGHGPGHSHSHEHEDHDAEPRDFAAIKELIRGSGLSDWVKERAVSVFRRIAEAEGRIHGLPPAAVHFHEVGAVDSIVDIVGACVALELLGRPRVRASAIVDGTGFVRCAHGVLPVPAPATLEILRARGLPLTQSEEPHELVTPTGAALLAEFVEPSGPLEAFLAERIGYGLGARDHRTRPNVLRATLGSLAAPASGAPGWEADTLAVLEANLDDINAEVLGHFTAKALADGALDVFHTPIQMKKSRPGVLLTVLCGTADADRFTEMMLRETTSFGVRRTTAERRKLRREFKAVATPFGQITMKLGWLGGELTQAAPEYESCRVAAENARVPVKLVYEAALRALER